MYFRIIFFFEIVNMRSFRFVIFFYWCGQRDGGSNGEGVAAVVAMEVTTMVIGDDSGCGNGGRDNGAGWW